jgi:hypothetical protein
MQKGVSSKNSLRLYDVIDLFRLLYMQTFCFKASERTYITLHFAIKHVSSHLVKCRLQHIKLFLSGNKYRP